MVFNFHDIPSRFKKINPASFLELQRLAGVFQYLLLSEMEDIQIIKNNCKAVLHLKLRFLEIINQFIKLLTFQETGLLCKMRQPELGKGLIGFWIIKHIDHLDSFLSSACLFFKFF